MPKQDQNWKQTGAGILAGYQHVFGSGLLLEGFLGGGYYLSNTLKTFNAEWVDTKSKASRVDFRLGFGAGYAF